MALPAYAEGADVNEYKLKINYRVWAPKGSEKPVQPQEAVFTCCVEDGQLVIPPDALRIIYKKADKVLGVDSLEWVGAQPTVFKCGALDDEQAAMLSAKFNAEGDLAMKLMMASEPEARPTIAEICAPTEGPIKILGPANLVDKTE